MILQDSFYLHGSMSLFPGHYSLQAYCLSAGW